MLLYKHSEVIHNKSTLYIHNKYYVVVATGGMGGWEGGTIHPQSSITPKLSVTHTYTGMHTDELVWKEWTCCTMISKTNKQTNKSQEWNDASNLPP